MSREVLFFDTRRSAKTMSQASALVGSLKSALRQRSMTYADVARRLGISEASVKRMFAQKRLSLERLEQICDLLGLEIADLIELAHGAEKRISELTEEQERELVSDPKILLVAVLAFNHWTAARILENYRLSEPEIVKTLTRLDKMRIVDLLPDNRIRIRLAHNFTWRKAGPIQRFFEERLQQEFFESSFLGAGELRVIVNGSLSQRAFELLHVQMGRIAQEFDSLVRDDRHLADGDRTGATLVMAIRSWEPNLFAELRREAVKPNPPRNRPRAA